MQERSFLGDILGWFTNYDQYKTKLYCFGGDTTWLTLQTVLLIVIVMAYIEFAILIYRKKKNVSSTQLDFVHTVNIFIICSICGYMIDMIAVFWAAHKLRVIILIPLAHYSWKLVFKAKHKEFLNEINNGRNN